MFCYIIIQGETHHIALTLTFKNKIQANYKAKTEYFTSIFLSRIRIIFSDVLQLRASALKLSFIARHTVMWFTLYTLTLKLLAPKILCVLLGVTESWVFARLFNYIQMQNVRFSLQIFALKPYFCLKTVCIQIVLFLTPF